MERKPERRALARPLDTTDKEFGGLGALYYDGTPATEARMGGEFVERFLPGAFRDWYTSGAECFCFYDHDQNQLLGRRSNGLKLIEDERGLAYQVQVDPNDPDHVRVHAKIRRGDVRGSSLIFVSQTEDFRKENGLYIREISNAVVLEIGPTPYPVYSNTTAEARSASVDELVAAARAACVEPPDENELALLLSL